MQTYTLTINEEQRLFLVTGSLTLLIKLRADVAKYPDNEHLKDEIKELDLLHGMLEDIPSIESDEPNIIHGLCY